MPGESPQAEPHAVRLPPPALQPGCSSNLGEHGGCRDRSKGLGLSPSQRRWRSSNKSSHLNAAPRPSAQKRHGLEPTAPQLRSSNRSSHLDAAPRPSAQAPRPGADRPSAFQARMAELQQMMPICLLLHATRPSARKRQWQSCNRCCPPECCSMPRGSDGPHAKSNRCSSRRRWWPNCLPWHPSGGRLS